MSIRPVDLSGMIQRTQDIGNIKHAEDSRPVADQYNIEVRQEKQESDCLLYTSKSFSEENISDIRVFWILNIMN